MGFPTYTTHTHTLHNILEQLKAILRSDVDGGGVEGQAGLVCCLKRATECPAVLLVQYTQMHFGLVVLIGIGWWWWGGV